MAAAETGSRAAGDKLWGGGWHGGQQKGEQARPVASPLGVLGPGGAWGKPPLCSPRKISSTRSPTPRQHSSFQVAELFP